MDNLRPTLIQAAEAMESVLQDNDWKGGWEQTSPAEMQKKLREEVRELEDAYLEFWRLAPWERDKSQALRDRLLKEAADVQNVCMMIADIAGCYSHYARKNGHDS